MDTQARSIADVCIIGAGITGLNATFVASRYLGRSGKIVLVDKREQIGGMWVDTYDYVRLHQPHPMFTVGNIKWESGRERSYLATKPEIIDHLKHCLDIVTKRSDVDLRLGREYVSHHTSDGVVTVTLRSAQGEIEEIRTKRLIKAYGFDIRVKQPLAVSSTRVRSVSPDSWDLRGADMRSSDAPVWVIGSGKTAMDTAQSLITEYPGREVNVLAGSGTYFTNRDKFFPEGARRWSNGVRPNKVIRDAALRFDGKNEAACRDWIRQNYTSEPTVDPRHYVLGWMSEKEARETAAGLNEVLSDHFVDAVDRDEAVELVLRSGGVKPIQAGSWLVNCTGYLFSSDKPYEPYRSADGAVLSIQTRSSTMLFSSFAGYYLTHLMFRGKLVDVPLYELDIDALHRVAPALFAWASAAQLMYNLGLLFDALPAQAFAQCGMDFDKWYPLPRQAMAAAQFMLTHRRDREHNKRSLDTLRDRFDIRCGALVHS